jgi:hypothetical protein
MVIITGSLIGPALKIIPLKARRLHQMSLKNNLPDLILYAAAGLAPTPAPSPARHLPQRAARAPSLTPPAPRLAALLLRRSRYTPAPPAPHPTAAAIAGLIFLPAGAIPSPRSGTELACS